MDFEKHIHQIWLQGSVHMPERFQSNVDEVKNLHPDWKYTLWDDMEIIKLLRSKNKIFGDSLIDIYYKLQHLHQKVDFARYIILHEYGGAYVDMDAKSIQSMDNLLIEYQNYEMIVSKLNLNFIENLIATGSRYFINNGVIIAKKQAMILEKLIREIINDYECKGWIRTMKIICINETTGPKKFTQVIQKYHSQYPIKILSHEYFEPCVLENCDVTDNTYFIHRHERSWFPSSVNMKLEQFYSHRYIIILLIFLFIICIFILWNTNKNDLYLPSSF